MLRFVFNVGLTRFFYLPFGNNYVKTSEDTHILSETVVSGDARFMRIWLSHEEGSFNSDVVASD